MAVLGWDDTELRGPWALLRLSSTPTITAEEAGRAPQAEQKPSQNWHWNHRELPGTTTTTKVGGGSVAAAAVEELDKGRVARGSEYLI